MKGLAIQIATDEQIAKGRLTRPDFKPHAQMVATWEPLSYRLEGGKYGNSRTEYYAITMGKGLEPDEIEMVRQHGWMGAGQTQKRMTIPNSLAEAREPWTYFMVHAKKVGLDISITPEGQLASKDIEGVFEVEAGMITLPTRIETSPGSGKYRWSDPSKGEKAYTPYARVPIAKLTDYVIPENVPVIFITTGDDDSVAAPAATTANGSGAGGPTAEALANAAAESGMVGATAESFSGAGAQINLTNKFGSKAPVFFTKEVQDAAAAGGLVDYLVAKGAIVVNDGVIAKAV